MAGVDTPQEHTTFEPSEARWLLNLCEYQKQGWIKRCSNAANHADIARRDRAADAVANIEAIIRKITVLTSAVPDATAPDAQRDNKPEDADG